MAVTIRRLPRDVAEDPDFFLQGETPGGRRHGRFPRCWRLSDGVEVTDWNWFLNREREPHRAVLVNGKGVEVAEVVLKNPNPPPPPPTFARVGKSAQLGRGSYFRLSPALRARIVALWNADEHTVTDIGEVVGVSRHVIGAVLQKARSAGENVRAGIRGRRRAW